MTLQEAIDKKDIQAIKMFDAAIELQKKKDVGMKANIITIYLVMMGIVYLLIGLAIVILR